MGLESSTLMLMFLFQACQGPSPPHKHCAMSQSGIQLLLDIMANGKYLITLDNVSLIYHHVVYGNLFLFDY